MRLCTTLAYAFLVGLAALSIEILLFSILAFVTQGLAGTFGVMLSVVLTGIAFGAFYGFRLCRARDWPAADYIAMVLLAGGLLAMLLLPVGAALLTLHWLALAFLLGLAALLFALLGSVFPVLCHLGSTPETPAGRTTGWVYAANILGATTGPLLTGLALLDLFSHAALLHAFGLLLVVAGVIALARGSQPQRRKLVAVAVTALVAISLSSAQPLMHPGIEEKLFYKDSHRGKPRFGHVVSNRHGLIHTVTAGAGGDIVYGHGLYDGRFNIDPAIDSNGVTRAYVVSSLHPAPRQVLAIGLATASWARALAANPRTERLTVVEIQPGYLDLIRRYPHVRPILEHERVAIEIDDGRRWLRRHPSRRFDVIVMNTTLHWRENSSNLLSRELFGEMKAHLEPGGLLLVNHTGCRAVLRTLAETFSYVVEYGTTGIAGDTPPPQDAGAMRARLLSFSENRRPIFDESDPRSAAVLDRLATLDKSNRRAHLLAESTEQVTGDNVYCEYKREPLVSRLLGMFREDKTWP